MRPSIAERDRTIVLAVAIMSLLPIGLALASAFESLTTVFLTTFAVAMLLATGLAFFLRSRFISRFSRASLQVQPTGRSLSNRAQRHADDLLASGFALTDNVIIGDADHVFTRPLGLFWRTRDDQVAIAGELGVQMVSRYGGEAFLVTASHDVVSHPNILVQLEPDANAAEIAASHNAAISQLRSNFDIQPGPLTPVEALLQIEQCEQATLRERRGLDTLNQALVATPDPMSGEVVRAWLGKERALDS